jgi:hypothetical protein
VAGVSGRALHEGFLGLWVLVPESCEYEQGEPPVEGTYRVSEEGGVLTFQMAWTDAGGARHQLQFSGVPDGVPAPFAGDDLADALSLTAESPRELTSRAYYRGVERMVAQRQLDETGAVMRVTQLVRLPSGESPANVAIYRRAASA